MRIPTFSRQTETTDTPASDTPASDTSATDTSATDTPATDTAAPTPVRPRRDDEAQTAGLSGAAKPASRADLPAPPPAVIRRTGSDPITEPITGRPPVVVTGPKPRASMLATLGLILGVASALLVLSGPLLGYGIGVAGLALVLSLAGVHATGKRHVAGKSDALIGMVLSLAAIVVGVLALTGSLSWLGTDMHPVTSLRQWLDTQFVHRF